MAHCGAPRNSAFHYAWLWASCPPSGAPPEPNRCPSGVTAWQVAPHHAILRVIDANAMSRSVLASQLRCYGIAEAVRRHHLRDARARLEPIALKCVPCEHSFRESDSPGQTAFDTCDAPSYGLFQAFSSCCQARRPMAAWRTRTRRRPALRHQSAFRHRPAGQQDSRTAMLSVQQGD